MKTVKILTGRTHILSNELGGKQGKTPKALCGVLINAYELDTREEIDTTKLHVINLCKTCYRMISNKTTEAA